MGLKHDLADAPDQLEALMKRVGRLLRVDVEPIDVEAEDLCRCYESCEEGARQFGATHPHEKPEHRRRIVEALGVIELQAAWHVLRGSYPDEGIAQMDGIGRRAAYLDLLYRCPDRHAFFAARERAIQSLSRAGVLSYRDYGVP